MCIWWRIVRPRAGVVVVRKLQRFYGLDICLRLIALHFHHSAAARTVRLWPHFISFKAKVARLQCPRWKTFHFFPILLILFSVLFGPCAFVLVNRYLVPGLFLIKMLHYYFFLELCWKKIGLRCPALSNYIADLWPFTRVMGRSAVSPFIKYQFNEFYSTI